MSVCLIVLEPQAIAASHLRLGRHARPETVLVQTHGHVQAIGIQCAEALGHLGFERISHGDCRALDTIDAPSLSSYTMRYLSVVICNGLLLPTMLAHAAPAYLDPDPDATRRVSAYLDTKDCPGAVKALNEGVKNKQRDVLLLAGAMFETGLCVKENWERAVYFYQLADKAGHQAAIHRLAAGYAVAGRDNALALWWAAQRKSDLPRNCIPAADPEKDPDGFAAALTRMPVAEFKACVYMTGVYSAIMGETEFPAAAARNGVFGDVVMTFDPARGAIDWTQDNTGQAMAGVVDGNKANTESRRKLENTLLDYMRAAGARTLARYARPDGIDPAVRIQQKFVFAYKP